MGCKTEIFDEEFVSRITDSTKINKLERKKKTRTEDKPRNTSHQKLRKLISFFHNILFLALFIDE